jgi:hypothetical protein
VSNIERESWREGEKRGREEGEREERGREGGERTSSAI